MHVKLVQFLYLIPLFPLIGAALIGVLQGRLPRRPVGYLASLTVLCSFLTSIYAILTLRHEFRALTGHEHGAMLYQKVFSWVRATDFRIGLDLMVDPLTAAMLVVITGIGFLIHVYSVGYMEHEDESNRYFSYLNLFVSFMLLLVMGSNIVMLFVGWEGVGACSYLLIGFYFREWDKADAGKKAFVVNRIGDLFFVIGILLLAVVMHEVKLEKTDLYGAISTENHLDFTVLQHATTKIQETPTPGIRGFQRLLGMVGWHKMIATIPLICLFLFIGATGKSAQLPLYVWLPDAMAGPTPVSALIHAATMVTAGIYMICRLNFFYILCPHVMKLIAWTGMLTALFAAIIATKQRDIKKVLAYSTMSQLGYMFAACGVGAFSFAMFHLFTHAFFKALLFLGAGSVIHAMHHEQDIFRMGGLKKKIGATHWTFLVGSLALAGVPIFAGFFSKDAILWAAWQSPRGGAGLFLVGFITACLTAFYVTRLYCLVFEGTLRAKDAHHVHESPDLMLVPLYILAICSALVGLLNAPKWFFLAPTEYFTKRLHGVLTGDGLLHEALEHIGTFTELTFAVVTTGVVLLVIWYSYNLYTAQDSDAQLLDWEKMFPSWLITLVSNKFYVDEIYAGLVVFPTMFLAKVLKTEVDEKALDGILIDGTANQVKKMGRSLVTFQNGDVQRYMIAITLGLLGVLVYAVYVLDIATRQNG